MVIVDTNVFMNPQAASEVFEEYQEIAVPMEVLAELDNLKTKEGERGFKARNAIRCIKKHEHKLNFLMHDDITELNRNNMIVDDIIIEHCKLYPEATLITNDISMEMKAKALGIPTSNFYGVEKEAVKSVYTIEMTEQEFEDFTIQRYHSKLQDVPIGQFVEIYNKGFKLGEYRYLAPGAWDEIAPYKELRNYVYDVKARDFHQRCAIRSLEEDEFTVITGPAGTGKTLLSLGESLRRMHKCGSTVHIFINPVKTRDTEQLGYYPGSRDEKLLSSFIGGILTSKLGDEFEVERLLSTGALRIYPFSDIRGIEIPAGDVMYITEAQNLSIDLIKLAIQRCANGAKLIIEGDADTQVDCREFEGRNNGLNRVIEVFTGTENCDFGYVNLPIIYRSRMAEIAESL